MQSVQTFQNHELKNTDSTSLYIRAEYRAERCAASAKRALAPTNLTGILHALHDRALAPTNLTGILHTLHDRALAPTNLTGILHALMREVYLLGL